MGGKGREVGGMTSFEMRWWCTGVDRRVYRFIHTFVLLWRLSTGYFMIAQAHRSTKRWRRSCSYEACHRIIAADIPNVIKIRSEKFERTKA